VISLFDNSKIKRDAPGFKTSISLNEGLRTIVDWYKKEANTIDLEKDALEDKLVKIYEETLQKATNIYIK